MPYYLKKLFIKNDKISNVSEGSFERGILSISDDINNIIKNPTLEDVKVGNRVCVKNLSTFLVTSVIKEIVERDKNKVIFETETSRYILEIDNE